MPVSRASGAALTHALVAAFLLMAADGAGLHPALAQADRPIP